MAFGRQTLKKNYITFIHLDESIVWTVIGYDITMPSLSIVLRRAWFKIQGDQQYIHNIPLAPSITSLEGTHPRAWVIQTYWNEIFWSYDRVNGKVKIICNAFQMWIIQTADCEKIKLIKRHKSEVTFNSADVNKFDTFWC